MQCLFTNLSALPAGRSSKNCAAQPSRKVLSVRPAAAARSLGKCRHSPARAQAADAAPAAEGLARVVTTECFQKDGRESASVLLCRCRKAVRTLHWKHIPWGEGRRQSKLWPAHFLREHSVVFTVQFKGLHEGKRTAHRLRAQSRVKERSLFNLVVYIRYIIGPWNAVQNRHLMPLCSATSADYDKLLPAGIAVCPHQGFGYHSDSD